MSSTDYNLESRERRTAWNLLSYLIPDNKVCDSHYPHIQLTPQYKWILFKIVGRNQKWDKANATQCCQVTFEMNACQCFSWDSDWKGSMRFYAVRWLRNWMLDDAFWETQIGRQWLRLNASKRSENGMPVNACCEIKCFEFWFIYSTWIYS